MMRKPIFKCVFVVMLVLFASSALAQVKVIPKVPTMPTKIQKIPKLVMPDLVIESFSINSSHGVSVGSNMEYPVSAVIKNIGNAAAQGPIYVVFQYYRPQTGQWECDRTKAHAIRINRTFNPNDRVTVSGKLIINKAIISDATLRVRAMVDSACFEEFPPQFGYIKEINENNNYSNEATLSGGYRPNVVSVNPNKAIKGVDVISLVGTGFGTQNPTRTVVVEREGTKVRAEVTNWFTGVIYFKIPQQAKNGPSYVYIADSSTLSPISSVMNVMVLERKAIAWDSLVDVFNLIGGAFQIRLHTWSGGSGYVNESKLIPPFGSEMPLEVPNVQFKTAVGHYRFLINDFNTFGPSSSQSGFEMSRQGCAANQVKLILRFESEGKELIGYYKVLGPAGKWRRTGAPDIQVDDAKVTVLFQFYDAGNGRLDYAAAASFDGRINASGKAWDDIIDFFMPDWDNKVKKEISRGVRQAINMPDVRQNVIDSLLMAIRMQLGLNANNVITKWQFDNSGIKVTFY